MTMPLAIVAGPPGFVTLYEVTAAPNAAATAIVFTVNTDQAVQLRFRVWDVINPATVVVGTEAGAVAGRRSLSVTISGLPGNLAGHTANYEILSMTTPPPTLRNQQGTVRLPKAAAIPVRFHGYDGPQDGSNPAAGVAGNWSNYTWAQYNPKGT